MWQTQAPNKRTAMRRVSPRHVCSLTWGFEPREVMKLFEKLGVFILGRTHSRSLYGIPF